MTAPQSNDALRGDVTSALLRLVVAAVLVALPGGTAGAQDVPASSVWRIPALTGAIRIDGQVDEPEWEGIRPVALTNLYPRFGSELTERTEIRIGYDRDYLYGSIRAFDRDPAGIQATTLYRDRWGSDDEFVIILDTFGDGENAAMFLVTPAGVRVDNLLSNDAEPGAGTWLNPDWNVRWDASATRTPEGWFAEMRIPWSSLRFDHRNGEVAMRLKTYRYIRRKNENQMFPATRPESGANPHFKPSIGQPVAVEGIVAGRSIDVRPYLAAGSVRSFDRVDPPVPGTTATDLDAGLDVKVPVGSGMTLDLTVNTDFAEVEADDQRLNLTRFSLLFPEKRPFFQERAGLFGLSLGGETALFYSRRIGLSGAGEPIPLLGGLRLAGRMGRWDVGGLVAQTGASDAGGGENVGVVRIRRSVGAGSFLGLMTTHRLGAAGRFNVAAGADASFRIGRHQVLASVATTAGDTLAEGLAASRARLRVQLLREEGWGYAAEARWAGRAFEPGLGFVQARDFADLSTRLSRGWRPGGGPFRRIGAIASAEARWRNRDGEREWATGFIDFNGESRGSIAGGVTVRGTEEVLPVAITLAEGVIVPPGRYRFGAVTAGFGNPEAGVLRVTVNGTVGRLFDGKRISYGAGAEWTPSPHLGVTLRVDRDRVDFGARSQGPGGAVDRGGGLRSTIARARLRLAFSTSVFLEMLAQHNSARELLVINGRLRLYFGEGRELWLVADEAGDQAAEPLRWRPVTRRVLIKYTHAMWGRL